MKLEFISESCNERFARMTATAFVAALDPTAGEIAEIKTAISEAVTNAIIHGYENTRGVITMTGEIKYRTITFSIHDDGCGIEDIQKAKEPLYTSKPNLERSGMGFSLMECFMDELIVQSQLGYGTTITMKKILDN